MKRQILIGIGLILTVVVNAQLYTPGGIIQTSVNNNVGIGTSTPESSLHILEGGFRHGGTGEINIDAPYIIGGRLKILDNGNVGIGITNPVQKLSISGGLRIARPEHSLYHLDIIPNVISSNNVSYDFVVTDYQNREDETILSINGQTGMIGIGITNPVQKLSISGGLRIARPEHSLYHLDIIPNVTSSSNVSYDFVVTDYQNREDETILSINGQTGMIGIGTISPQYKLDVCGTIRATEVKVDLQGSCGADFVFKDEYKLMDLKELEAFVKTNKHLPEIASEKEMEEKGINMNEFQIQLLQKIEELTLYTIQQQKEIEELKKQLNELK